VRFSLSRSLQTRSIGAYYKSKVEFWKGLLFPVTLLLYSNDQYTGRFFLFNNTQLNTYLIQLDDVIRVTTLPELDLIGERVIPEEQVTSTVTDVKPKVIHSFS
jgi:hypothetical protein